jgi:hypothetical protein
MRRAVVALAFGWIACAPAPVVPLDAGIDAGSVADAGSGVDAGPKDAGPPYTGPCLTCAHGTWCLRDTCVPECAPCTTDGDCVDGGSCDPRGSCVFLEPGCTGPEVTSVRIGVVGAWILPDVYEFDVATGRLGATLVRSSSDGGTTFRDGGVVFIDAGAWPSAPAWCPFTEVLGDDCAFDVAELDVEVTGGGQSNRFSYYTGASRLPAAHPLLMDLFSQFFRADAGHP